MAFFQVQNHKLSVDDGTRLFCFPFQNRQIQIIQDLTRFYPIKVTNGFWSVWITFYSVSNYSWISSLLTFQWNIFENAIAYWWKNRWGLKSNNTFLFKLPLLNDIMNNTLKSLMRYISWKSPLNHSRQFVFNINY